MGNLFEKDHTLLLQSMCNTDKDVEELMGTQLTTDDLKKYEKEHNG